MSRALVRNIFNVTCTNKDTEYDLVLPANTERLLVQARANDIRMSEKLGDVANASTGTYLTVKAAQPPYFAKNLSAPATRPRTLYFASGTDGAVVEVEVWS